MASKKNHNNEEDREELSEEILTEFRYELENLDDIYDEDAVKEIIENIISEYIENDDDFSEEMEELLKEEWEIYLDNMDTVDRFDSWRDDEDEDEY